MMLVRNLRCVDDQASEYGSWLAYWKLRSGTGSPFCSRANCKCMASSVVHVQKVEAGCSEWYLVPVCEHHFKPSAMALLDLEPNELIPVKTETKTSSVELSY